MAIFAISLAVVSGICIGTGVIHLFIGLRRRGADMKHLTFGLFALAYAGAVLTGLLMYRATTLSHYLALDLWSGVFAVLAHIFLLWFVAIYTDVQPLPVLAALTILFAAALTAHLTRPTLIHGEITGITFATLPWGEQITFLDAAESTWQLVYFAAQLLTIGYLFYACIRQYRRGERRAALALGAGLLFFVATIIFDMFVESGVIDFVLASDYGFLGLAIVMSLQIVNDVIRTEEELGRYRGRLEALVEERTADLEQTNEQLTSEIGERRQAEETLHQRVEELAVLGRISQTLATMTDLPQALEQVCEAITHLFDAQVTYIVLPSSEEAHLQVLIGFERESGPVETTPLPVSISEAPYFNRVLSQAEPLTVSDIQTLPVAAPLRGHITRQQIQNAMLVPLVVRGTSIGLLAMATDRADRVFTADQIPLAETIAGDVASAIENTRLSEQAQRAAVSEERGRIARDLHDSVTQTIYSASLIAEALPRVWERDPGQVRGNLRVLLQLIRGGLAEMRTLLFELRPTVLEEASLGRLLHQLADVLTGRTQTPVEVTVQGQADVPAEVKTALYRIAQEVFNNIAKHAGATQVAVTLQHPDDGVILTVQDDGRGFDPDSVPADRMGLRIMRERARKIGAEFAVESEVGQGTEVRIEWRGDDRRPTADDRRQTTDSGGAADGFQV